MLPTRLTHGSASPLQLFVNTKPVFSKVATQVCASRGAKLSNPTYLRATNKTPSDTKTVKQPTKAIRRMLQNLSTSKYVFLLVMLPHLLELLKLGTN